MKGISQNLLKFFSVLALLAASALPAYAVEDAQADRQTPQNILVTFAEQMLGTPYKLGGHSLTGIDCSGLVDRFYRTAYQMILPRTVKALRQEGTRVRKNEPEVGDLLFFKFRGRHGHVGIYAGNGTFLHASTSEGVIYSSLSDGFWNRRLIEVRRVPTEGSPMLINTSLTSFE